MISEKKMRAIQKRMLELDIYERDLAEKYTLGQGKGGQKAQKSCNSVFLKHIPTGCIASSCASRSREENRFLARRVLCDKIVLQRGLMTKSLQDNLALKKQKKRRKRRSQEKRKESLQ